MGPTPFYVGMTPDGVDVGVLVCSLVETRECTLQHRAALGCCSQLMSSCPTAGQNCSLSLMALGRH